MIITSNLGVTTEICQKNGIKSTKVFSVVPISFAVLFAFGLETNVYAGYLSDKRKISAIFTKACMYPK